MGASVYNRLICLGAMEMYLRHGYNI